MSIVLCTFFTIIKHDYTTLCVFFDLSSFLITLIAVLIRFVSSIFSSPRIEQNHRVSLTGNVELWTQVPPGPLSTSQRFVSVMMGMRSTGSPEVCLCTLQASFRL